MQNMRRLVSHPPGCATVFYLLPLRSKESITLSFIGLNASGPRGGRGTGRKDRSAILTAEIAAGTLVLGLPAQPVGCISSSQTYLAAAGGAVAPKRKEHNAYGCMFGYVSPMFGMFFNVFRHGLKCKRN